MPGDDPVTPSAGLVDTLEATLSDDGFPTQRGPTWTTSAFYRETIPEIERHPDDGVLTLDMEAAAIWAGYQYRADDTEHEIWRVYDGRFVDAWPYDHDSFPFTEPDLGIEPTAHWITVETLRDDDIPFLAGGVGRIRRVIFRSITRSSRCVATHEVSTDGETSASPTTAFIDTLTVSR